MVYKLLKFRMTRLRLTDNFNVLFGALIISNSARKSGDFQFPPPTLLLQKSKHEKISRHKGDKLEINVGRLLGRFPGLLL